MTHCPSVHELPPPPAGRTGWPWTVESASVSATAPDGRRWPRITVLTPSYNQAAFIEEALRSVLLQGYPNVEYLVVDGASTDGTIEIIKKYEPWLASWTSVPDRGAEHALNTISHRITGELVALMPTSDLYLPDAFRRFAEAHARTPDFLLLAPVEVFEDGGDVLWVDRPWGVTLENVLVPFARPWSWHSLGLMVPVRVFQAAGPLNETLRYCRDEDWLCRLLQHAPATYLDEPVARWRRHPDAVTPRDHPTSVRARLEIVERYWHLLPDLDRRGTRARYSAYEASVFLARHPLWAPYWDRRMGMRLLLRAARQDPWILAEVDFLRLARRALIPRRWLRSNPWKPAAGS